MAIGKFLKGLFGGKSAAPERHFDESDRELHCLWGRREFLTPRERMLLDLEFGIRSLSVQAPRPKPARINLDEVLRPETFPDEGTTLDGGPVRVFPGGRVLITTSEGKRIGISLPVWWPSQPEPPAEWNACDATVVWEDVGPDWGGSCGSAKFEAVRVDDDASWSLRIDDGEERYVLGPSIELDLLVDPSGGATHIVGSFAAPDEATFARLAAAWTEAVSDGLIAAWVIADLSGAIPLWTQSVTEALGFVTFFCAERMPCNPDLQGLIAAVVGGDESAVAGGVEQAETVHLLAATGWLLLHGDDARADMFLRIAEEVAGEEPSPELLFARGEVARHKGALDQARTSFKRAGEAGYGRAWTNLAAMAALDGDNGRALEWVDKAAECLTTTVKDSQTGVEQQTLHHPSTLHLQIVLRWLSGDRDGAFEAMHLGARELSPWVAECLEALIDEGKPDIHGVPLTSVRVGHQESLFTALYLLEANGTEAALGLARQLMERVLEAEPSAFEASVVLSDICFAQGDAEHGRRLLDDVLERTPLSARLYGVVAERAAQAGHHSRAAAAWGRAFELAPESEWLRRNQCLALIASGQLEAASEVVESMAYDQVDVRLTKVLHQHIAAAGQS